MPKHAKVARHEYYDEDGTTDQPTCPRCGSFLAQHDDRQTCGKCGYAEIEK
jgi:small subunit ribosomal protein S27Ae